LSSRERLIKEAASSYLIQMVYIETFAYLRQKYGSMDILENKLKEMGRNIARSIYEYYEPPHNSITGTVKEVIRVIAGIQNIDVVKKYSDDRKEIIGFSVIFKKCPLCVPEVEEEGIYYCTPTMAIIEEYGNLALEDGKIKKDFDSIEGKVVQSVSSGDDVCEYYYKIIRE
jgi:hypothetical protein